MFRFCHLIRLLVAISVALCASQSFAQDWPSKPSRIVVPFSAGGSTDAIARVLAKKMEAATHRPIAVENITGGGSIVGVQAVLNAPADGSSMLFTGSGTLTVLKHTNSSLPVDPENDLTPITFVNTLPHWIVVRADRPEKTFQEFVASIRNSPGKISISVNAVGSTAHLALANWAKANHLDIIIVPYRGSPAAMVDLLGGVTSAHVDVVGSSIAFVKSGKARALTLLQETPLPGLAVPASEPESKGGLLVYGRHVLAVKKGTPPAVVDRIYKVVNDIAAQPDFVDYLAGLGFERATPTPSATKELLTQESKKYAQIVRTTNIKLN